MKRASVFMSWMAALEVLRGGARGLPLRAWWGAAVRGAWGPGGAWAAVTMLEAVAIWAVELGATEVLGTKLEANGESL